MGITENPLPYFYFFIPGVTKLGQFVADFVIVILQISPTIEWRVEKTFSIKILVLWLPELEFCDSQNWSFVTPGNLIVFPKAKIVHDGQAC